MRERWLVFYNGKKELAAITLRGSFPGEVDATVDLLAGENGISKEAIRVVCEMRGGSMDENGN